MIKINERFSIEREADCWRLEDTVPSDHRLSKTGFVTRKHWYPRLHMVVTEIFERCPEGAKDLKEMHDRMVQIKADVYWATMGG